MVLVLKDSQLSWKSSKGPSGFHQRVEQKSSGRRQDHEPEEEENKREKRDGYSESLRFMFNNVKQQRQQPPQL